MRRIGSTLVTPLTIDQFMRSTRKRLSQWKFRELSFNSQEKEHREYLIYSNGVQLRVQSINHALYADGFQTLARSKEDIVELSRHNYKSFRKHVQHFRDLFDSYREQEKEDKASPHYHPVIKPATLINTFVQNNCSVSPDAFLYDCDDDDASDDDGSSSVFGVRLFRTLRPVSL